MTDEKLILMQLKSSEESFKTQFKYINQRIGEIDKTINYRVNDLKINMCDKIDSNTEDIKIINKEIKSLNKFKYEHTAIIGIILYILIQVFNTLLNSF